METTQQSAVVPLCRRSVWYGGPAGGSGRGRGTRKTMEHQFYHRLLCAVCALALLCTAVLPTTAFAEQADTAPAAQSLTASEVQQMQKTDAAVTALTDSEAYADMTTAQREEAALQQLDELTQQGLVAKGSVYADTENGMVSFAYPCGVLGGILLTDPEDEDDTTFSGPEMDADALEQVQLAAENSLVGKAAIYYAFDNGVNSSRYPYYSYMKEYWSAAGLETNLDQNVTVSDLRGMAQYDLCVLSAHGAYYTYQYGWLWKRQTTAPVVLLLEKSDLWSDLRYGMDLLSHRVIKVNGMYAVTGDFFRAAYRGGKLNGTIVMSETCEFYGRSGHVDTALADGLLAGGAEAVVGFVNNVYTVYSRSILWAMTNRLIEGDTLQEAIDYGRELYGTNDVVWYNNQGGIRPHATAAYPIISGDPTAQLPHPYSVQLRAAA